MRALSVDLRERILYSYDNGEGTREAVAHRFRVSVGRVKKLLQQRRRTGDIAPRHRFAGRKPVIVATHRDRLRSLLAKKSDLTLKELRATLELNCSWKNWAAVARPLSRSSRAAPAHECAKQRKNNSSRL